MKRLETGKEEIRRLCKQFRKSKFVSFILYLNDLENKGRTGKILIEDGKPEKKVKGNKKIVLIKRKYNVKDFNRS